MSFLYTTVNRTTGSYLGVPHQHSRCFEKDYPQEQVGSFYLDSIYKKSIIYPDH